jgi:hypothetical protein
MSKNVIFVLMYHHHKPLDHIYLHFIFAFVAMHISIYNIQVTLHNLVHEDLTTS